MIHVLHNGELLEERDFNTWSGEPTVGHTYMFEDKAYNITSITVDTKKGYCELTVTEQGYSKLGKISPH